MCCFYENLSPICDFWSWKIAKRVLESPGKVLEFFQGHGVRTLSQKQCNLLTGQWACKYPTHEVTCITCTTRIPCQSHIVPDVVCNTGNLLFN